MITPHAVDGIVWSKAELAQVIPSRSLPDPDAVDEVTRGGWAEKCRDSRARNDRPLQLLRTGFERTPEPVKELARRVLARCNGEDELPGDVDLEAATVGVDRCPIFAAVPWWLETRGLEFTLEAFVRSYEFSNQASHTGYIDSVGDWLIEHRDTSWNRPESADTAWRMLRTRLMRASDAQWSSAREVAERLFKTATIPAQGGLAFAFNDTALADATIDAALPIFEPWAKRERSVYAPFIARLVGVASSAAATRVLVGRNSALTVSDLYTALAHQGHAAVPTIAAAYRAVSSPLPLKVAKVLLAVRTDEAVALLTSWAAEKKAIAPVLKKHLSHPTR